ncbi:MAG: NPCBM/NEW2 domain-containing protein [Candidatus Binatia bacterium]
MLPAAAVHDLALRIPPHVATAAVLMAAAMLTLVVGLLRGRKGFLPRLPGVLFVLVGAAVFWPLSVRQLQPWRRWAWIAAAVALMVHVAIDYRQRAEPRGLRPGSVRASRVYLAAALLLSAALLLYHLGTYSGPLLIWEAPVVGGFPEVGGFAHVFKAGQSIASYTAQRFLWDDGVLSAGQTSLFYGAPTYALFHVAGFSAWTLRFAAVVATLLSIAVIYALGRRFFGPVVAGGAALTFGLNCCVLFYGRYGSSPAGTILAGLLALWATWLFLDDDRSAWWRGGVCALALYIATLQYSPARIVVVVLLGFIPFVLAVQWRRLWWQRAVGCVVIIALVAGVWTLQRSYGRQGSFLAARGEQYFDFVNHPSYIKDLFGKDLLRREIGPGGFTLADKIELLYRVVEVTFPQYAGLMSPVIQTKPLSDDGLIGALPQLYYAPLALFILWGFVHSLVRWRAWPHACLLLWLVGATIPLLLTNRVDTHRSVMFVIPLALWAALGVWEAARAMAQAKVPRPVQHLVAGALALTVVYSDADLLHRPPVLSLTAARTIVDEVATVPGRVLVGATLDHREVGWILLHLLERTRRDPRRSATLLANALVHNLQGATAAPNEFSLRQLQRLVRTATVILVPAARFRAVAAILQRRGLRVAERGTARFRMFRVDGGAAVTGVPNQDIKPLPTIVIPPTPTPIPLAPGPRISLTTLTPLEVTFGFAPPKIDRTWSGAPIVMGGVRYARGLGTHAWCRMTYAVPPNATAFQAIIGLSDDIRRCEVAAVTFEVRDENDRLLSDSGLVDVTTPPRPIHADVQGTKAITLVVTEGGNGRDCDHANWAQPAFLLASATGESSVSAPASGAPRARPPR